VLDAVVSGPTLSINTVFDALAARWSDHYRRAIAATAARPSWQMRLETLKASWHDLVLNGLAFKNSTSRTLACRGSSRRTNELLGRIATVGERRAR
jgi:hypothetical protein